jgi:2-polyprenyl-3-methyl-5-hydroxy-6-metoxy-1,4-benzoquinol methylase
MAPAEYYDYKNHRPINLAKDGCELIEWSQFCEEAPFARHPKGFPVFLKPDKIAKSDEYKESDPYTVELNLKSGFHQRRLDCTLAMIAEALNQVQGIPSLLDLGCGQGHITARIKEHFPNLEISALDYSISAIEYAVDHFPGIDFAVGDAYEPPYPENHFDIVVCNNIWEHVPDPLFLIKSIKKVIKPNGFLIISTPSRYRLRNLLRVFMGKKVTMSEHHVTEYTVGQVLEQLDYGGFKVIKIFSKSIRDNLLQFILVKILSPILFLIGSHHQLESTVFYLARRVEK